MPRLNTYRLGLSAPLLAGGIVVGVLAALNAGGVAWAAPGSGTHVVTPGETLSGIAHRYGTDVATVRRLNGLGSSDRIVIGRKLRVPTSAPTRRLAQPAAGSRLTATGSAPGVAKDRPGGAVETIAKAGNLAAAGPLHAAAVLSGPATNAPTKPMPPAPNSATSSQSASIAAAAESFVGAPYRWGGTDPTGFDCSGLVWYLARQVGRPIPRDMGGQYASGSHPSRQGLERGDLLFFKNTYKAGLSHDGVYVGDDRFVSALDERHGVLAQSMDSSYWLPRFFGATRLPARG